MIDEDEQQYRSLAVAFCDIAVNGTTGRVREDPVVEAITEGHDGSSCGFLLHFVAEMLGIREPWVNRASINRYRVGENLSLLFQAMWGGKYGPQCARRTTRGQLFRHGDFLLLEKPELKNDDHVCIVARDFDGDVLLSYDGGQRGASGKPEDFRFCERPMRQNTTGRWQVYDGGWGKQVSAVISLPELVDEARSHQRLEAPAEPSVWLAAVMGAA